MDQLQEQIEIIREVFNYSRRFSGAVFVIKIDYQIIEQPLFPALVKDLALLHQSGIRMIVIPGAKARIDDVLSRYAIRTSTVENVRISSQESIPFIKMAAFDVSNRIMSMLAGYKVHAVIGNWVRARSLGILKGVDYEQTGLVEKIDVGLVRKILDEEMIPIFPCIGWNSMGKPYNISSNELATVVSTSLGARKLFFVGSDLSADVPEIPEGAVLSPDGRISRMSVEIAQDFLNRNRNLQGSLPEYVELGCRAASRGVERVHILDGRIDGVILKEIFSNLGLGIMIHANTFDSIRPMHSRDIADVLRLMEPLVHREILVKRTEAQLAESYQDYVVYEMDGTIHGCGALKEFSERSAEIMAVAVDQAYSHLGIGQKIVDYLIAAARQRGLKQLFALSTQSLDWFQKIGFKDGTIEDLPAERRTTYDTGRKSRIFLFSL